MKFKNNRLTLAIFTAIIIVFTNLSAKKITQAQIIIDDDIDINIEQEELKLEKNRVIPWKRVKLLHTLKGHRAPVYGLAFNHESNILISSGSHNDPRMKFWEIATGKKIADIRAHAAAVFSLVISPDGQTIASGGLDSAVNLWNGVNRKYLATFLLHSNSVLSLAITPDSSTLISGGLDGIRVWNLKNQRPVYTLAQVGNPSYALAVHKNGYILASGDNEGTVQFWNLKTGKFISEFYPHEEKITGLLFTPDGKQVITTSDEKNIKVWDISTGKLVKELIGHQDNIREIALSPDGQTLASAGKDGVRIWHLPTETLLVNIPSLNDWVESLAFSPDGTMLAMGLFNNEIQVWQNNVVQTTMKEEEELK